VTEEFRGEKDAWYLSWHITEFTDQEYSTAPKNWRPDLLQVPGYSKVVGRPVRRKARGMERQLEQLSCFINRVASDGRMKPIQTSLYLALCNSWIDSRLIRNFPFWT
jgi:hypothetical protein